ncbi:MAG TPA: COX15/CtaA family protein, partial [Candidatus Binataceae bacterium]|nr:COX15/CtaA family protein [Candidatus Binataceae bacterium]
PPAQLPLVWLAAATTGVIYLQILIGAVMRHMGAGLAIPDFPLSFGHLVPPTFDELIAINFAHRCGAVVVTIMVVWTAARAILESSAAPAIRRTAIGLLALLAVQITLGALTVWTERSVLAATGHVAIGAAVLATSLALTLRAYNAFGLPHRADTADAHPATSGTIEPRVTV